MLTVGREPCKVISLVPGDKLSGQRILVALIMIVVIFRLILRTVVQTVTFNLVVLVMRKSSVVVVVMVMLMADIGVVVMVMLVA